MSSASFTPAAGTLPNEASIISISMHRGTRTEASSITGMFMSMESGLILQYEYAMTGSVPICTASITASASPVTDDNGPVRNAIPPSAMNDSWNPELNS